MNNNNSNLEALDLLNVFGVFLSCLNYDLNMKESSNDDIIKEVRLQTDKYLQTIIEQNNKILNILESRRVRNENERYD